MGIKNFTRNFAKFRRIRKKFLGNLLAVSEAILPSYSMQKCVSPRHYLQILRTSGGSAFHFPSHVI